MDFTELGGYILTGLDRTNIVLGKNGCGKSRLLKQCESSLRGRPEIGALRYLSPERGGLLQYEAGIEQNITANVSWLADTRRTNQAGQFRQQSAAQFRRLELLILREIEQTASLRADPAVTFDRTVARINELLDRVYLKRGDPSFVIHDRQSDNRVQPAEISSGESELISLGIECLVFEKESVAGKTNLLLMDEPDVHLHPDLQARFARFLEKLVASGQVSVLLATHSTALLGAMSEREHCRLAFMRYGDTDIRFTPTTGPLRKVLPVFGAHPLSNVFNQAPVLLVEGDDDERIWQQAVRSANGRLKVYPCTVDGVGQLTSFERDVVRILDAVYDDAIGYSLRDRDSDPLEITDLGPLKRMRLNCRAAENLLLTDEVIASTGSEWETLAGRIHEWLPANMAHPHHSAMEAFAFSGFDRMNGDLKEIRNDLMGLLGSNKPWEVVVGQAIARLILVAPDSGPTSLVTFLGPSVCRRLLGIEASQEPADQAT
ncbi:MAG TPA: AAA family ATPase [Actinomycetota bacterium]|nr:AAA family ATPase [Gemmatimonadales bacterium]HPE12625.1 AAA family ATPase [Actinomycetota bacterium]